MERIKELIAQLQVQSERESSAQAILSTANMLVYELLNLKNAETSSAENRVAVIHPSANPITLHFAKSEEEHKEEVVKEEELEEKILYQLEEEENIFENEAINSPAAHSVEANLEAQDEANAPPSEWNTKEPAVEVSPVDFVPDNHKKYLGVQNEVEQVSKSVFQDTLFSEMEPPTVNDMHNKKVSEVGHQIIEPNIKDLRKAIGINDRYRFINELFRGDETMYERSIKTINNFNIYAEAEYWINRELKVKLAWKADDEAVQEFDQLVRRRFSLI